ncbi:uncharacterized protein TrAtP1_001529 [Trichoderma atroviride]|uniref:uncharacterized protein n=1 Tax=Hypocrea atroviridis TaxID=63577 RepID=UPI0033179ACF|nr:hypothetical protein TrAtP1_001529 [Trichoderma atroviride]
MGLRVEMLVLRTKEREERRKWLHRARDPPPLFLVRRRLAAAGNRRGQDLPEREGRGGETRDEEGEALHLVHGTFRVTAQASGRCRFLFGGSSRWLTNNGFWNLGINLYY